MTTPTIRSRLLPLADGLIATWMPFATAAVLALGSFTASAATADAQVSTYRGLSVEVIGSGQPLIMLPGLNSGADTWRETCAALQPEVQCHLLQLPGFAGQAAIASDAFLDAMRERVLAYVDEHKLTSPVVIGHSLGGLLQIDLAGGDRAQPWRPAGTEDGIAIAAHLFANDHRRFAAVLPRRTKSGGNGGVGDADGRRHAAGHAGRRR